MNIHHRIINVRSGYCLYSLSIQDEPDCSRRCETERSRHDLQKNQLMVQINKSTDAVISAGVFREKPGRTVTTISEFNG